MLFQLASTARATPPLHRSLFSLPFSPTSSSRGSSPIGHERGEWSLCSPPRRESTGRWSSSCRKGPREDAARRGGSSPWLTRGGAAAGRRELVEERTPSPCSEKKLPARRGRSTRGAANGARDASTEQQVIKLCVHRLLKSPRFY
jgi:hypothetical protein